MRRIERPLGVYLITTYDFLVVGLIPLLTFVFGLRHSDVEIPFYLVLLSVTLYFAVMGAAVWAGTGDNTGRWVLLAVVTFTALQWIANAALVLASSEVESGGRSSVIGFISRGSTALALNWWYFNRASTAAYYKQS
jgi:hypothetical protein